MKAKYVSTVISASGAEQRHYKLTPPFEGNADVVVSAVRAPFSGPETYIFPADAKGEITDWGELEGSFKGGLNHEEALQNIGYKVENEKI